MRQRLLAQTWETHLSAWPANGRIELPEGPVRSVASVKYTNTAGVLTTVSSGAYRLDTRALRAVLQPAYQGEWPTDVRSADAGVIVVTYICGLAVSASDLANVAPGIRDVTADPNDHRSGRGSERGPRALDRRADRRVAGADMDHLTNPPREAS